MTAHLAFVVDFLRYSIFALAVPRLVLIFLALTTNVVGMAFEGIWWRALLAWAFLPVSTLVYIGVWHTTGAGPWTGLSPILFVVAVLVDLGLVGGLRRSVTPRTAGAPEQGG